MYWGENYNLETQTLTRINRPCFLSDRTDLGRKYVATENGYVEWGRISKKKIYMEFISDNIEFSRWMIKDYSDKYMITVCKRFSDECMRWINERV